MAVRTKPRSGSGLCLASRGDRGSLTEAGRAGTTETDKREGWLNAEEAARRGHKQACVRTAGEALRQVCAGSAQGVVERLHPSAFWTGTGSAMRRNRVEQFVGGCRVEVLVLLRCRAAHADN